MMAMDMFVELLDTAINDAHKNKSHQNIAAIKIAQYMLLMI
jgi:hypothetical protein